MPSLHSPVVTVSVPSMSMIASSKKSSGCRFQTFSRARLIASNNCRTLAGVNRRQKSPAVVGSGIESAWIALRKASSLRRRSMCSRHVPSHSALRGEVQHMIRLIRRTVRLENRQSPINGLDQSALASDSQHQRHAAINNGLRLVRQLILQPGRAQNRRCPPTSSAQTASHERPAAVSQSGACDEPTSSRSFPHCLSLEIPP